VARFVWPVSVRWSILCDLHAGRCDRVSGKGVVTCGYVEHTKCDCIMRVEVAATMFNTRTVRTHPTVTSM